MGRYRPPTFAAQAAPQQDNTILWLVLIGLAAYVVFGIGKGCPVATTKSPFPTDKFRLMIIEETEDRANLSSGQLAAIRATDEGSLRAYVKSHSPDEMLVLDKDSSSEFLPMEWKVAWAVKRDDDKVPWLLVGSPKGGFSGPLPEKIEDTMAIAKRYGE